MKQLAMVAVVIAAAVASASAKGITGDELHDFCQGHEVTRQVCLGYVMGISDALRAGTAINGVRACIAGDVTNSHIRNTVAAWLKDHPAERPGPALNAVLMAVSRDFPCR